MPDTTPRARFDAQVAQGLDRTPRFFELDTPSAYAALYAQGGGSDADYAQAADTLAAWNAAHFDPDTDPVGNVATYALVLEYVACNPSQARVEAIVDELVRRGKIQDAAELDSYYQDVIVETIHDDWHDPDEPQAANA